MSYRRRCWLSCLCYTWSPPLLVHDGTPLRWDPIGGKSKKFGLRQVKPVVNAIRTLRMLAADAQHLGVLDSVHPHVRSVLVWASVCRYWRDVLLGQPLRWRQMNFAWLRTSPMAALWRERAASCTFDVIWKDALFTHADAIRTRLVNEFLSCLGACERLRVSGLPPFATTLVPNTTKLKIAEISTGHGAAGLQVAEFWSAYLSRSADLYSLTWDGFPLSLPSVQWGIIRVLNFAGSIQWGFDDVMAIIAYATGLRSLRLWLAGDLPIPSPAPLQRIFHRPFEELSIGGPEMEPLVAWLMPQLVLSQLHTLQISLHNLQPDCVLRMLSNSKCRLNELEVCQF